MYFGYNTNGFAHHSPKDAITVIKELGYDGVAITIDHHLLNPFHEEGLDERVWRMNTFLENHGIEHTAIETGARYLLDPWRKHQPTLLSPNEEERELRFTLLVFAVRHGGPARFRRGQFLVGRGRRRRAADRADGSSGGWLQKALRRCGQRKRPPRLRAGTGHVHRHHAEVRRTIRPRRSPQLRSDARYRPFAVHERTPYRPAHRRNGKTGSGTSISRT